MKCCCAAVVVFIGVSTVASAADAQPAGGDKPVLATLRAGHPRLILLEPDLQRVQGLIKTDAKARKLYEEIRSYGRRILSEPPVIHKLIGPRLLGQSRTCLARVYTLATLYRLDGDKRYAQRAEKEMLAAAAFPDWNPKHFLDTAEMTHALAIGYDWLYDVLSPESRATIRKAIVELGLKPAENVYRKRMWWSRAINNWNQVCNGGIAVGALAVADEEPALAGYILEQARESIRIPTKRLEPDGGWDEGPGYWHYAMSYTAYYIAAMQSALGTDFRLHRSKGMEVTGLFRIHCSGPSGLTFNYADGSEHMKNASEMFLFSRLYDAPVYAAFERQHIYGPATMSLLWYDPRGGLEDVAKLPLSAMFSNVDVAFLRSAWNDPDAMFIGFKGGNNAANHAHLDLGTFVLDGLGERWASELGGDDYNMPAYFGEKRWTYYRLRTEGQNTLLINGENQEPRAAATIVKFKPQPGVAFAVADLSAAYKTASRVQRGVALLDPQHVLIQDEIRTEQPLEVQWGMHTHAEVRLQGATATLRLGNKEMRLSALSPSGGDWSVKDCDPEPPQRPLPNTRRLAFTLKVQPPGARLQMVFTPQRASGAKPPAAGLDEWAKTFE